MAIMPPSDTPARTARGRLAACITAITSSASISKL
jgi:hypothetical protein